MKSGSLLNYLYDVIYLLLLSLTILDLVSHIKLPFWYNTNILALLSTSKNSRWRKVWVCKAGVAIATQYFHTHTRKKRIPQLIKAQFVPLPLWRVLVCAAVVQPLHPGDLERATGLAFVGSNEQIKAHQTNLFQNHKAYIQSYVF